MEQPDGHVTLIKPTFKWKISDVLVEFIKSQKGDKIVSPAFTLSDTADLYWQIYLYPKPLDAPEDCFGIYLKSLNSVSCSIGFKFHILDELEQRKLYLDSWAKKWFRSVFTPGLQAGSNRFALKSKLLDLVNNSPAKSVVIICEIDLKSKDFNNECPLKPIVTVSHWHYELEALDCFERLLLNSQHSDVTFVVRGGEKVPAHKNLLAARSPVFELTFQTSGNENQTCEIKIEDMDIAVFTEVLRFIYTGKVNKIDCFLYELLIAADKYQVEGLTILCNQRMRDTLTIENSINYLKIASSFNLIESKEYIMKFIFSNGEKMGRRPYVDQLAELDKELFTEVLHELLMRNNK